MRTVTSKDGTRIAFDQLGEGPALILVTGASATRRDAASLASALAPDFTVFAFDRRARGGSGDTAPYAVEREIEDIEALIDEAGGSAFVFGHSSGAVLALEAARLLPTKIAKLALYEPPFIIDDSRAHMPEGFPSHLNELIASGRRGDAVESFMALVGTPPEMVAGMRQSPWWPQLEANAQSLVYDATIMADTEQGDPAALRKWASVTVPTLVMDGTVIFGRAEAHAFMRHGAEELANVLPNAQRRILEGQDHGPADDVLVPALKAFFLS
ncbi:MAG TPA: alpha/beta hydrolase [Ktedonobacterales bacterium]|nr:alpha/beta hydrolase [Ktedonobacterales bacterium]